MNDDYNDNYRYNGSFDTRRFSSQWIYATNRGWRPWCYTYGLCAEGVNGGVPPYQGLQAVTSCGPWAYLANSDRAILTGGAVNGVYPPHGGAICRETEPTGSLVWPHPAGLSDVSDSSTATPVTDECQCLSRAEIGEQCAANMCAGLPGRCRDGYYDQGTCFDAASGRASCRVGTDCGDDLHCVTVRHSAYNTKSGSWGAMYGLPYDDQCFGILKGGTYVDSIQQVVQYGQHSESSADWAWCYTRGQCWSSNAMGGDSNGHSVPNPGACGA